MLVSPISIHTFEQSWGVATLQIFILRSFWHENTVLVERQPSFDELYDSSVIRDNIYHFNYSYMHTFGSKDKQFHNL